MMPPISTPIANVTYGTLSAPKLPMNSERTIGLMML